MRLVDGPIVLALFNVIINIPMGILIFEFADFIYKENRVAHFQ